MIPRVPCIGRRMISATSPRTLRQTHMFAPPGETTYYMNVYAFINQLKALAPLKSEEVVRAKLPSCLREAAARWYSAELSAEERQDRSVRSLQLGWYAILQKWFKPRATEAIVRVMDPTSVYSWRDVRAGRSVTEWAQSMPRDAQDNPRYNNTRRRFAKVKGESLQRIWVDASAQQKEFIYQQVLAAVNVHQVVGVVRADPGHPRRALSRGRQHGFCVCGRL